MDEEMRLHAELRARALREAGAVPDVAERAAKNRFGNRTSLKEDVWDQWSFVSAENAWRDLVFAGRLVRANPGFALVPC